MDGLNGLQVESPEAVLERSDGPMQYDPALESIFAGGRENSSSTHEHHMHTQLNVTTEVETVVEPRPEEGPVENTPPTDIEGAVSALNATNARITQWMETAIPELGKDLGILRDMAAEHVVFYAKQMRGQRFLQVFERLVMVVDFIDPPAMMVAAIAPLFDFSEDVKANGYRSLLVAVARCVMILQGASQNVKRSRTSFFLSADFVYQQLESHCDVLNDLGRILIIALEIKDLAKSNSLFVPQSPETVDLVKRSGEYRVRAAFGAAVGFQHSGAHFANLFLGIHIGMASYNVAYEKYRHKLAQTFTAMISSGKFAMKYAIHINICADTCSDSERCARLMDMLTKPSVRFVKAFWNLTDNTAIRLLPQLTGPQLNLNRVMLIPYVPTVFGQDGAARLVLPGVVCSLRALPSEALQPVHKFLLGAYEHLKHCLSKEALTAVAVEIKKDLATLEESWREHTRLVLMKVFSLRADELRREEEERGTPVVPVEDVGDEEEEEEEVEFVEVEKTDINVEEDQLSQLSQDIPQPSTSQNTPIFAKSLQSSFKMALKSIGTISNKVTSTLVPNATASKTSPPKAAAQPPPKPKAAATDAPPTIRVRLLSYTWKPKPSMHVLRASEQAKGLIVHFHGGGFVANSSKSHEVYLRSWARDLNVPILSVDYSLAPKTPYPGAMHECFYAYMWALENAASLGTTAERVVVTGDSAGGNLSVAIGLRCIMEGVRPPDAIVASYPALNVSFSLSPARLTALYDPLLPQCCVEAYAGPQVRTAKPSDPLLSPMEASDELLKQLPPLYIMGMALDPLLDDSVEFARRVKAVGGKVVLKVAQDSPHGALNFKDLNAITMGAYGQIVEWLQEGLGGKACQ